MSDVVEMGQSAIRAGTSTRDINTWFKHMHETDELFWAAIKGVFI